ncbi:aminotransferase class I/II-fold pyridoxal phosphate-dependent enzyme [Muricoccus radiodurans]|uniref:aminotransferase class I/II-fold pyridoxal phosphate-dependent enzyme n=1 Tax=Muricoccus radiodurans TaxID=2231721 RepID=UPI003CE72270
MTRPARLRLLPRAAAAPSDPFLDHPLHREVESERRWGAMLRLRDPYYRVREAQDGPVIRLDGAPLHNFTNYDYLGLSQHPEVIAAHAEAAREWGTSVGGSRITSGERPVHGALEQALADFYGVPAGVAFVSGHAAAISVILTLMGPRDLVLHDALAHNCLVLGAESSRAARRSFRHNDLDDLDEQLRRTRHLHDKVLIVSEGLFSMSGDGPDLRELVRIKDRHGAWLMMDEAHALGVLGATGRGIAEHAGLDPNAVEIWFGTLSKTLVGCGGYVCGSRALVDILRARAPGLVYSVGMPAPTAAASLAALRILRREPERVARLRGNSRRLRDGARALGLDTGPAWGEGIVPVILGGDLETLRAAQSLEARGVLAFPVLSPGVPKGEARLRFFASAAHGPEDIEAALSALRPLGRG